MDNPQTQTVKVLKKAYLFLDKVMDVFESGVGMCSFVVMILAVLQSVVWRYFLHIPLKINEELSRYVMIIGVFYGVSMACRYKAHVGMTFLVDKLPPKTRRIMQIIAKLIETGVYIECILLMKNFISAIKRFNPSSPAMQVPMVLVYTLIMISFVFSSIRSIMVFIDTLCLKKPILNYELSNDAVDAEDKRKMK